MKGRVLVLMIHRILAQDAMAIFDIIGVRSGTAYTVNMVLGSPIYNAATPDATAGNTFRMIIDTGSGNDVVLGSCCTTSSETNNIYRCGASSTCIGSSTQVNLNYAGGSVGGFIVRDTFSSAGMEPLEDKPFTQIETEKNFLREDYDGILGIGYDALISSTGARPPTLISALVEQKNMKDAFGLLLCGTLQTLLQGQDAENHHSGFWVVGGLNGPDGEEFYDSMLYTPVVFDAWYVVTVSDIGFGTESLGFDCSEYNSPRAIIDSGTTNLSLPPAIYNTFIERLQEETLKLIPDFDPEFFDFSKSCCGPEYCNPASSTSPLLQLPAITITLAMTSDSSTSKHMTISIPPEYYWRPERNGNDLENNCRALGVAQGKSLVLGNVFMDGLYIYHDREEHQIGIGIAENCPNRVTSSKTLQVSTATTNWCDCFSSERKTDSLLSTYFPFINGGKCFFILWWMYVVLASLLVILIATILLSYYYCCRKRKETAVRKSNRLDEPHQYQHEPDFDEASEYHDSPGRTTEYTDIYSSSRPESIGSYYSSEGSIPTLGEDDESFRDTYGSRFSDDSFASSPIRSRF